MPRTDQEQATLDALTAKFETGKKALGKGTKHVEMSNLEKEIIEALGKEFDKDGQTSVEKIAEVVDKVKSDAAKDLKNDTRKIGGYFQKGNGLLDAFADVKNWVFSKIPDVAEKQIFEKLASAVNTNDVLSTATQAGIPTKQQLELLEMVSKAAGPDRVLSDKELLSLVKSPKFTELAGSTEMTVANQNGKGTLVIGSINLALDTIEPKLRLADDATLGPVKAPKDPINDMIKAAAHGDGKIDSKELAALLADPAFIKAVKEIGGVPKVKIHNVNGELDTKDAIIIQGTDGKRIEYNLNNIESGLRFEDKVVNTDVPAKAGKGR